MKRTLPVLLALLACSLPLRAQEESDIDADGQPQTFVVFSVSMERGTKIGKTILQNKPDILTEGKAVVRALNYQRGMGTEEQCDEELIVFLEAAEAKGAKAIAVDNQLCHGPAVKAKLKEMRSRHILAGIADLDAAQAQPVDQTEVQPETQPDPQMDSQPDAQPEAQPDFQPDVQQDN